MECGSGDRSSRGAAHGGGFGGIKTGEYEEYGGGLGGVEDDAWGTMEGLGD